MKTGTIIPILLLILSCTSSGPERKISGTSEQEIKKSVVNVNQYILKRNRNHIRGFMNRTGWDMEETGSGLFFMSTKEGYGQHPVSGDRLRVDFTMRLIDGEKISSGDDAGLLEFSLGEGGVIAGLEEGLKKMKEGGSSTLIVLPHLAYGNFGDVELGVPPDAILLFELTLLKIN